MEEMQEDISFDEGVDQAACDDNVSENKQGFLSKLKSGAGKVGSAIKSGVSKTATAAKNLVSERTEKSALIKEFEQSASPFLYERDGKSHIIYGKRDIPEKTILFLLRDKNEIRYNMEIHTNGQQLIITEFESTQIIPYGNEANSATIDCFMAYYKLKEQRQVSNSIVQTNNITVGDNFQGDVNVANQAKISDLNEIETLINNAKPGLFHRSKLQEANSMFVTFKGNISKGETPKKDFIDKFTAVLKVVAPAAVSLVLGLI